MPRYADGFLIPIPKKNLRVYLGIARKAGKIWREHGALEYCECAGDDMKIKGTLSFLRMTKAKPNETVILAWIVYKSRAHRDRVNAKVMKDPRILKMAPKTVPFDINKLAYGGFRLIVDY